MCAEVRDSVPVADVSKRGCSEELQSSLLLWILTYTKGPHPGESQARQIS